jgi:thiamine biosynthesis lipoprotein
MPINTTATISEIGGHVITNFRAMGSDMEIQVWGDLDLCESLCEIAPDRLEILEQAWSRFRADSELTRVNSLAGITPIEISPDLKVLIEAMLSASELTRGLFDPTMARVIEALGYRVDFSQRGDFRSANSLPTFAGAKGIKLIGRVLELQQGAALDPGAIGKGLAGDIICEEFMASGATGVLANIGGDIAVAGTPGDDYWRISIANDSDLAHNATLGTIESNTGGFAVATSSTAKRTWGNGLHHVIDPRTGMVSKSDLIQATVVADTGWQAEAFATAALVLGLHEGTQFLNDRGLTHFLVPINTENENKGVKENA